MIQLKVKRDELLKPLQMVSSVSEKRQTLPILSHVLLAIEEGRVSLKGTDLEIAIEAYAPVEESFLVGQLTLPGRKLLDICRNLPADAVLELIQEENRCLVRSGGSQFSLATLPVDDFPGFDENEQNYTEITITQKELLRLIQATSFAIAQRDVRYYLNGMLLEISGDQLTFVATDGHRLALNRLAHSMSAGERISVIIPRKGVMELMRLLSGQDEEAPLRLLVNSNHVCVQGPEFNFVSRLIEGQFPNYEQVIPRQGDKLFQIERSLLKQALVRASILSNERLPGISMQLRKNSLCLLAKNPEKEEAKEEIPVNYDREDINVGFNVTYLIDVLNVLHSDSVKITFLNSSSAFLVEEAQSDSGRLSLFVIMPMRL